MIARLLPYPYKLVGLFLSLTGVALLMVNFWYPLDMPSTNFAFYSSFLEEKYFTTIRNNLSDEIILILLVAGASLMVFSKEKVETEGISLIRGRALFRALLMNTFFTLMGIMFIYGSGFIYVLVLNLVSLQWLYLINLAYLRNMLRV